MFFLPFIAAASSIAGAATSFIGARQQAQAAEQQANYNAQLARQQAEHESLVAAENARRKTRENARIIGSTKAAIAASGMAMTGTPLAILGETVMRLERDVLDLGFEAATRARALHSQAAMSEWEGRTTAGAYRTAGWANLAQGISSAAASYGQAQGLFAPKPPTP